MSAWIDYHKRHPRNTVVGQLLLLDALHSPQLDNTRHLLVWLPPSYNEEPTRRYPVLYMHDGDNLFDEAQTHSGEWRVDETLTQLASDGLEAIAVGIPNMGSERFSEYSPYPHFERGPAKGDAYLRFIIDTVKPRIDADFRTLPTPANTAIAGSSMGGLISLYGFLKYPDIFGLCGAFSPVFWYGGNALAAYVSSQPINPGKVYVDVGGREGEVYTALANAGLLTEAGADAAYVAGVHDLYVQLQHKAYGERVQYVEAPQAAHNEAAWSARFPAALRYLLSPAASVS